MGEKGGAGLEPQLYLVKLGDPAQEAVSPSSHFLQTKKIVLAREHTGRIT